MGVDSEDLDVVTTLASVRLKLMLDIFVVTMVDMVGTVDTLVDMEDLDVVTTLASVKLRLMLDILVDTMADLLVTVDTLVDLEDLDVDITLESVRLKLMLDILVDTMVDLLVTVDTLVDLVATVDTLDKLLNRRTNKERLSPIKIHTFFDMNKLDKKNCNFCPVGLQYFLFRS